MKKLLFSINIKAPAEKVWNTLWNDRTYPQWTGVFASGSKAETDWNEGSRIWFLDETGSGVYSVINKKIPNRLMSIKNLGYLWERREQHIDEKTSAWSGAMENYILSEENGRTGLWVEIEVDKDDVVLFAEKFPKALEKVKELVEE